MLLTPMTLRAKRPSGLTSSTQVTFHHTSWTPAKANEAKETRERRGVLIIRGKEEGDQHLGVHGLFYDDNDSANSGCAFHRTIWYGGSNDK